MSVVLRPSREEDLEWLVELRAEVLREDLERLGRYDPVRVRQRLRDGFSPAATRIVVVDGEEVGCVAVRDAPDARWVEHFYIMPAAQNRGVGGRVLSEILEEPSSKPTRLNVLQGSAARRLYERRGFVVDAEDAVDVFMTLRG
ncbi:GNAT family N-acetyltransferase [Microbacterium marinilacus]|nr:GNAT family N-acetyltransferase [Microbacterium marinilacus]